MSGTMPIYPVEIVLAPQWWHRHVGICFDRDFFFYPARRVEQEALMERVLYERWGQYGLGSRQTRPEVGPVHLAAGYLLQEMLGCKVEYRADAPPQVIPAGQLRLNVDPDAAFASPAFKAFADLCEQLKRTYGYLTGDVNFSGVLNIALDLRGQEIFVDMYTDPDHVRKEFAKIAEVITRFVDFTMAMTGTSSISVNRNVRHLPEPVVLHSECTHTMISERHYQRFLMEYDIKWSRRYRAFGVHYCGPDPHRYAALYAQIPGLAFVDVGARGDIKKMRQYLTDVFLNLRLDPVRLPQMSAEQIRQVIFDMAAASGHPNLTGICCINLDDSVKDQQVTAILQTVVELRKAVLDKGT